MSDPKKRPTPFLFPLRFSVPVCSNCGPGVNQAFADLVERLNKVMIQLEQQLGQVAQLASYAASVAEGKVAAAETGISKAFGPVPTIVSGSAPGAYPGIAAGSHAIIQGPAPGGPSPVPPYITPHTMIVGEGSTPVKLLTFADGQIPIGATGSDPKSANIVGGTGTFVVSYGVDVKNGPNTITIGLDDTLLLWIEAMGAWSLTVLNGLVPNPGPGPWIEE